MVETRRDTDTTSTANVEDNSPPVNMDTLLKGAGEASGTHDNVDDLQESPDEHYQRVLT
ncbi:hypothetical protein GJ744_005821 [Endocarpon pusillum]|uniref:Uncharacterized protein n=1 Tax=Endocarpon pusillum TaxID=364733 RepID=A0A8H7DZF5_9EURO|nr:hypothetical protein GJ744_005821 [Endocarpon pusillum]